ncbi:MAG: ribonuclease Z [Paludibacteraceae bacterium]|nr:ribonuclease Z [Paludibacteraceae bacterium]MBQ6763677.1 ribonuclease Z [Paludibacteraceae bacterium]
MSEARVTILGCGSAKPTKTTSPSGQLVELCDKSFLVDCGEGVLLTLQRLGVHTGRLYNIFISHLHGDHCFGLIGLLTTLGMLKRTQPMHIYAHPDLERLLTPLLEYHCNDRLYDIIFHPINPRKHELIYEDRTVSVETVPLKHSVPTCGFLFKETHRIKNADGTFGHETRKRYAYCSDTQYSEKIIPIIEGVGTLYHESTFLQSMAKRCKEVKHSTAADAATIAQKAGAGKLILGHYSARVEDHGLFLQEAKPIFDNTFLAEENLVFEL